MADATLEPAQISKKLSRRVSRMKFAEPVTHVYNPLQYAWETHADYLARYGTGPRKYLLLGMNPGPWGMAQTGVPFGEVALTRDWLKICGTVKAPKHQHPKRPIQGLACQRSEVSGSRLWGWAKKRFKTPKKFFKNFVVLNHCPLVFMEASGKNRTPDKLPAAERDPLMHACDDALVALLRYYQPSLAIGVGAYAKKRLLLCAKEAGLNCEVGQVLHPSPASPMANRGWEPQAESQLESLGIQLPA